MQILRDLHRELDIWTSLAHPHILPLYGACLDHGPPMLVCEFMQNGNMIEYLVDHPQANRRQLVRASYGDTRVWDADFATLGP